MGNLRHRYVYEGPVMEYDRIICNKWKGETVAKSENLAKVYLGYQFKKDNNRLPHARITLPGKLKELEAVM